MSCLNEVEWREALDAAPARPSASGFSARAHYLSCKTSYVAEFYLSRGDHKSAMFYLRAGHFGLNARMSRAYRSRHMHVGCICMKKGKWTMGPAACHGAA
jgi:hypothetical protein